MCVKVLYVSNKLEDIHNTYRHSPHQTHFPQHLHQGDHIPHICHFFSTGNFFKKKFSTQKRVNRDETYFAIKQRKSQ